MSSTNSVQGETMHANCFEHKIDWDKRCLSLAGAKPMHVLYSHPGDEEGTLFWWTSSYGCHDLRGA